MRVGSKLLRSCAFTMRPLSRSIVVGQAELRAYSHMPVATNNASTASRAASHTCLTPLTSLRSRTPLSSLGLQSRYLRGAGVNTLQPHRCVGSAASASSSAVPPTAVTTDGAPGTFTPPCLSRGTCFKTFTRQTPFCSGRPLQRPMTYVNQEWGIQPCNTLHT